MLRSAILYRAIPYKLLPPPLPMKTYIVTIDTEERYRVEAESEDAALEKLEGLDPYATEVVDTNVEEDTDDNEPSDSE